MKRLSNHPSTLSSALTTTSIYYVSGYYPPKQEIIDLLWILLTGYSIQTVNTPMIRSSLARMIVVLAHMREIADFQRLHEGVPR